MRGPRQIGGNNTRGQPEARIIDHAQRFVIAVHFDHRRQRGKQLFAVDLHGIGAVDEQPGGHVKPLARAFNLLPAADQFGAFR